MPTPRRNGLFLAAVVANLLPVVWFSHLPSGDGPAHVYNASLIGRYLFHPADPVRTFLQFNWSLPPNLLTHGLLATLMAVMSPHVAERVFVALYVVLLPFALRYAMRGGTRETGGVEFLGLVAVFNYHFHWGFYNFIAGLVAYLFALGYWLRLRERPPTWRRLTVMATLVCVAYFCHPVPLVEFWLTAGALYAIDARRTRSWRLGEIRQLMLASTPAGCLYLHYLMARAAGPSVPVEWPPVRFAGSVLVKLFPLSTFTPVERLSALSLSATIAAAAAWAWSMKATDRNARGLFCASALVALAVFAAPMQAAGGTLITTRLVYFPLFLSLIWLATVKWPASWAAGFAAAGIGFTVIGLVSRWPIYERYDQRMTSFLDMASSRDGGALEFFKNAGNGIAVTLDKSGTPALSAGAWGYVAANRRSVLLSDYEAGLDYFPFIYRAGVTPTPSRGLLNAHDCPLADKLIDDSLADGSPRPAISEIVWIDADRRESEDAACLAAYGKRIVAERSSADGTLVWIDGHR